MALLKFIKNIYLTMLIIILSIFILVIEVIAKTLLYLGDKELIINFSKENEWNIVNISLESYLSFEYFFKANRNIFMTIQHRTYKVTYYDKAGYYIEVLCKMSPFREMHWIEKRVIYLPSDDPKLVNIEISRADSILIKYTSENEINFIIHISYVIVVILLFSHIFFVS